MTRAKKRSINRFIYAYGVVCSVLLMFEAPGLWTFATIATAIIIGALIIKK